MRTAGRIREIALSLGLDGARMQLVVNRVRAGAADVGGEPVPLIAEVPSDPAVEEADLEGQPIITIPDDSPARLAIAALAARMPRDGPGPADRRGSLLLSVPGADLLRSHAPLWLSGIAVDS